MTNWDDFQKCRVCFAKLAEPCVTKSGSVVVDGEHVDLGGAVVVVEADVPHTGRKLRAAAALGGRRPVMFLIWSNEHAMWWRANRSGYTQIIEEAGRYEEAAAERIVRRASLDGQLGVSRVDPVTGDENREMRLGITAKILGLPMLESSSELTKAEASRVIDALIERKNRVGAE